MPEAVTHPILLPDTHAPWTATVPPEQVASWNLLLKRDTKWDVAKYGASERPVTEWTSLFFAAFVTQSESLATEWHTRWEKQADAAIAAASPAIPAFALWWATQCAQGQLGAGAVDGRQGLSEVLSSASFGTACDTIEHMAEVNKLPCIVEAIPTISDLTSSCLERDGGVLWRSWLTGSVPAYQLPLLTFWSPDPVTAKWIADSYAKDELSVLVRNRLPFLGVVNTGVATPNSLLQASQFRQHLQTLLRIN